jgi:hypothetical protein
MTNTDNLVLNNGLFNCDAMAEVEQYCTYVDVLGNEVLNQNLLRFPLHHMRLYTNDDRGRLIGYSRWTLDGNRMN